MLEKLLEGDHTALVGDLAFDQLFNYRGEDGLAGVVVDHVDDLCAVGIGQLVKVVMVLLIEDIFGDGHALIGELFYVVVLPVKEVDLVIVK